MKVGWKRRFRSEKSLGRKSMNRPPKLLFLIVCEDAVASPGYFNALRTHLKLSTTEVEVCGKECDSAPISVVDYAIKQRAERRKQGVMVDRIWCVVDVDKHDSLHKALDKAQANGVNVAVSAPCFELWYLLHFVPGGKSYEKCDHLIKDLKRHIRGYEKGTSEPFDALWPMVDQAIRNAEQLIKLRDSRRRNPCTEVHCLINALRAEANTRLVLPPNSGPPAAAC